MKSVSEPPQMMSTSDRLRLREVTKYYCAVPSPLAAEEETDVYVDGALRLVPPALSHDLTLNCLAQLAALKLRCRRSFVSIIDDGNQHIIAESTRTISLFNKDAHADGDGLLLGPQFLPRGQGICPVILERFTGTTAAPPSTANRRIDSSYAAICDLFLDPELCKDSALAQDAPDLRYYLGVPIRTELGFIIGVLSVVHDEPRPLPTDDDVTTLQEISTAVMAHLEDVRMKQDHRRAERLMDGLGKFVQGGSSISAWTPAAQHRRLDHDSLESADTMKAVRDGIGPRTGDDRSPSSSSTNRAALAEDGAADSSGASDPSSNTSAAASNSQSSLGTLQSRMSPGTRKHSGYGFEPPAIPSPDAEGTPKASPDRVAPEVRRTFDRASNLIRESMDLDVTLFLEIPANNRVRRRRAFGAAKVGSGADAQRDNSDSAASSSSIWSDSDNSTSDDQAALDRNDGLNESDMTQLCDRIGFATRLKSSLERDLVRRHALTISGPLLHRMATKYPDGHIFHFDSFGCISSGDDSAANPSPEKRKGSRRKLGNILSSYFPGARSLIFLPLYDSESQEMHTGFLGWTADPARALQPHEIVYVASFANSIICEVKRLESQATGAAKSNFISSMSHELRSPLHGIQAAAELIRESNVSPSQAEFVSMIENCLDTMLDTMNHLLDHAKINSFIKNRQKSRRRRNGRAKFAQETYSLVSQVDLSVVVEQTVGTLVAGHKQHRKTLEQATYEPVFAGNGSAQPAAVGTFGYRAAASGVDVIVDVGPRDSWKLQTEVGSWRRIVMNLVGNALKYTDHGYIYVKLRAEPAAAAKHHGGSPTDTTIVTLTVTDSGRGISEDYLKHKLFTPFSQENNLSVGAGLGLSLVDQMVSSLNGSINVKSEVGAGTRVVVSIPVSMSTSPSPGPSPPPPAAPAAPATASTAATGGDSHISTAARLVRGKRVCLMGFDQYPSIYEPPTGILSPRARTLLIMKDALQAMLAVWFGVHPVQDGPADLYVVHEAMLATGHFRIGGTAQSERVKVIAVGAGQGNPREVSVPPALALDTVCLGSPVGPIHLARAIARLFDHDAASACNSPLGSPLLEFDHIGLPAAAEKAPVTCDDQAQRAPTGTPQTASSPVRTKRTAGAAPAAPVTPTRPPETNGAPAIDPLHVLLVDDNQINLKILVTCIKKVPGVQYTTASDGREALTRYAALAEQGKRVAHVFMDISMPVMDGFEATARIREFERENLEPARHANIIALTGLASVKARQTAEARGFDQFMPKPAKLAEIRSILAGGRTATPPG